MRFLVTGSAGFIGFHLSLRLLKKKYEVYGLDSLNNYYSLKLKKKRLKILLSHENFFFKKANLVNYKESKKIINIIRPDIVYHLAAQPGVLYSYKNPLSYRLNNIVATKNLLKIVKKIKIAKLIFSSSSSVYGDHKKCPITENFKLKPKNYYAKTKVACENLIKKSGVPYIIFRIFTAYGSLGRPDMLFSIMLRRIYKNLDVNLYNHGNYLRDFTYIDDVIDILVKAYKKNIIKKIINICSSNPVKIKDLCSIMMKKLNKKFKINFLKRRKGEMIKTYGSNKVLRRIFQKNEFQSISLGVSNLINNFTLLERKIKI
jgi:UDP-glucuronate 4-epimerase